MTELAISERRACRALGQHRSTQRKVPTTPMTRLPWASSRWQAIRVARKLKATDVIEALCDLFVPRDIPARIRSDNDPEFVAVALREWIAAVGAKTAYIEPGSPWENGNCESYSGKLRDDLLNGEIFYTLKEAQIVVENWRQHYNTVRPHSSQGY